MGKDDKKINSDIEFSRFGLIATLRGYVTLIQIQQALDEQIEDNVSGRPHRILGRIFREKGWLNEEQVKSILAEMGVE